ncbi:MAG: glycosyltransferase family 4 protein [Nevskia sp.]
MDRHGSLEMLKSRPRAIAINGRFLTQRLTGVQRHAIETVRALDALLAARDPQSRPRYELLVPRGHTWSHGPLSVIAVREVGRRQGQMWEQFELPLLVPRGAALLNLCNTFPILARWPLVTVHDASVYVVPGGYTHAFVVVYRLLYGVLRLRSSAPVMTVSMFSADELVRHAGIARSRITVVGNGADHWSRVTPDDAVLTRLGLVPGSYVLGVASENPNKNLTRLVDAFASLGPSAVRLVLVGGRNARVFAEGGRPDPDWIVRAGQVSDAELAALYRSAICFAFPSLYEGFGLPPLEAMRFGCPVLSSRASSLPEICGDAAQYCDGLDVASIATGLSALISDADLRARLIAAGNERITHFRWQQTAAAVLQQIEACPA